MTLVKGKPRFLREKLHTTAKVVSCGSDLVERELLQGALVDMLGILSNALAFPH